MNSSKPLLYATLKSSSNEVRHVVIEFANGLAKTKLIQLSRGVETTLDLGTQADMEQKANEVTRALASEGFKSQPLDGKHLVYEPLPAAVGLAQKMGFSNNLRSRTLCKS